MSVREIDEIIGTVARAAPEIRDGLSGRRQKEDAENPSGEVQLAADVWADELLEERLTSLDSVGAFASEEREGVIDAGEGYSVTVDPLDGSSNLKSNNSMGTILGIYDADLPASGRDLVGAAYVLYGPITTMVSAVDGEVTEYVIEGRNGEADDGGDGERSAELRAARTAMTGDGASVEIRPVKEDLSLPDDPVVYGFGGRVPDWTPGFTAYAREIEDELKLRYGGAMIGDVNQVVTYGGIFAYPGLESRPEGKLRLLYEGNPMAYIVEAAGGASSDGERSILDVEATDLHQRVPVHLGNEELIERLEAALD